MLTRGRKSLARRVLATVSALFFAAAISACTSSSPGPVDEHESESPAQIHNRTLAEGAEALLMQTWDGEWDLPVTGNVRSRCDAGGTEEAYRFYGSWLSPDLAEMPGDRASAQERLDELHAWLEADGWSELEGIEFTSDAIVGVNALGTAGAKPESGIAEFQVIYYYEGDVGRTFPHVVIDIDSLCLAADL